jgi:hypothetical protein
MKGWEKKPNGWGDMEGMKRENEEKRLEEMRRDNEEMQGAMEIIRE